MCLCLCVCVCMCMCACACVYACVCFMVGYIMCLPLYVQPLVSPCVSVCVPAHNKAATVCAPACPAFWPLPSRTGADPAAHAAAARQAANRHPQGQSTHAGGSEGFRVEASGLRVEHLAQWGWSPGPFTFANHGGSFWGSALWFPVPVVIRGILIKRMPQISGTGNQSALPQKLPPWCSL